MAAAHLHSMLAPKTRLPDLPGLFDDTGGFAEEQRVELPVKMSEQELHNWCWAAVIQGLQSTLPMPRNHQSTIATKHMKANDQNASCEIEPDRSETTGACGRPCRGACNATHSMTKLLEEWNLLMSVSVGLLPQDELIEEFSTRKRPVPIRVAVGDIGHFILVGGYEIGVSGKLFLLVFDPRNTKGTPHVEPSWRPYEVVQSQYPFIDTNGFATHTYKLN